MSLSKKIDLKTDFAGGVLSVWGLLPLYNLILPLRNVYVYKVYLFAQGRGGGGKLTREKGNSS